MGHGVSRRRLLGGATGAAGAGFLGRATGQTQTSNRPRVLALIGDRYHNPDYIRVSLDRVFKEVGVGVDYTIAYDQLSRDLLRNYDLFLCFRDGMIWPNGYLGPDAYAYEQGLENSLPEAKSAPWITEEQGAAVKDFVTAGGGGVTRFTTTATFLYPPGTTGKSWAAHTSATRRCGRFGCAW